ncbi:MAG: glycosyltransferase [Bacteroidetes bacterium]|jgi:1,2-diacylglycerol 3-beta-glucosyltransferase|nr:glycosyltransferase [Bacteroidota bacterium]
MLVVFGWILLGLVGAYVLHQLVLAGVLLRRIEVEEPDYSRKLSILVAARNEEANIAACLESLLAQQYPAQLLDIHLGDDASTDHTAQIVQHYAAQHAQLHYHAITTCLPGQGGKQNVLAQLAPHAQGELILITDADVVHPPQWAARLAAGFADAGTGMVTAATLVQGRGLGTRLQALDWLMGISLMKGFNDLGLPISPVGNNMAIRTSVYWQTGGYAHIPFSLTEDYKLWEAVRPLGYRLRWQMHPWLLVRSQPIRSLGTLLAQRKRWFRGGQAGPRYALASFGLSSGCHLALLLGAVLLPVAVWLPLLVGKALADLALLLAAAVRLRQLRLLWLFPLYQPYLALNLIVYLLYFPFSGRVRWKGRTY